MTIFPDAGERQLDGVAWLSGEISLVPTKFRRLYDKTDDLELESFPEKSMSEIREFLGR